MDGRKFEIQMPLGANYSRALKRASDQKEFDTFIFLMEELCYIEGGKMNLDFYKELYCDDYFKIMEVLASSIQPIR